MYLFQREKVTHLQMLVQQTGDWRNHQNKSSLTQNVVFSPRIKFVVEVLNPRPNHIWSDAKCRSDNLNCSISFLQSMLVLGILAANGKNTNVWPSGEMILLRMLPAACYPVRIWKVKDSIMIS